MHLTASISATVQTRLTDSGEVREQPHLGLDNAVRLQGSLIVGNTLWECRACANPVRSPAESAEQNVGPCTTATSFHLTYPRIPEDLCVSPHLAVSHTVLSEVSRVPYTWAAGVLCLCRVGSLLGKSNCSTKQDALFAYMEQVHTVFSKDGNCSKNRK